MPTMQLCPFINFQGRAREAMEHYHKMLGGSLDLQTAEGRIAHGRLEAEGGVIVGSDGHPDYPARTGDAMALALRGSDQDRIRRIFDGLAEGGTVQMPLSEQPWGGASGWLIDRFGIHWTIGVDPS
jgi:PhnB protein